MSAHGPMPKSSWIFPMVAVALFGAVTVTGYEFTPSAGGLVFAVVLLAVLLCIVSENLFRTRVGRGFIAVRERDYAAEVLARRYPARASEIAAVVADRETIAGP